MSRCTSGRLEGRSMSKCEYYIGLYRQGKLEPEEGHQWRLGFGDPPDRIRVHLPYSHEANLKPH